MVEEELDLMSAGSGSGTNLDDTDYADGLSEEPPELVTLGQEYAEAIWTPDIYFPDSVNIERPGKGIRSKILSSSYY